MIRRVVLGFFLMATVRMKTILGRGFIEEGFMWMERNSELNLAKPNKQFVLGLVLFNFFLLLLLLW